MSVESNIPNIRINPNDPGECNVYIPLGATKGIISIL
tara:strand:+ start:1806 stop:1916 length:111 start_codon:yes stop_codon:yes gene_type:complete